MTGYAVRLRLLTYASLDLIAPSDQIHPRTGKFRQ